MNGSVPFLCRVFAQHMGGRSKLSSSAVGRRIHPYPDGRRRSAILPYGARGAAGVLHNCGDEKLEQAGSGLLSIWHPKGKT